ncbi:MAG: hypothetical protein ACI9OJ_001052 [Myxococcota bacterium]|jgi:hypothetical protein
MNLMVTLTVALMMTGQLLTQAPPIVLNKTVNKVAKTDHKKLLPPSENGPRVQLALLLDTSSSMSGLIDQARTQLWKVAGEFARSDKDGRIPLIEVALYEYGHTRLSAEDGFIRQVTPFTSDLDLVSEHLFALTTSGGSEHCGQVIDRAVSDLKWTSDKGAYKVIYIAGNEPFTQGPVRWQDAIARAVKQNIMVNTVHCGDEMAGANSGWKDAALLADGQFLTIDQNRKVAHVASPQDKLIAQLGAKLNETYVPYGASGSSAMARQVAQDNNVASSAGATVQRMMYKSTLNYRNDAWDLVDALDNESVKLGDLKADGLPEAMRSMNETQRRAYLAAKKDARKKLRTRIAELSAERERFVRAERQRLAKESGVKTLDQAMIESMRRQAAKNGYAFH